MPRTSRLLSISNTYHVILRGINQQVIFEEKADYVSFLSILKTCKEKDNVLLFAYCLMDNHVHLLVREGDVPLHLFMSHIEIRYARWYNQKYDRSGYLFQERYKSCPVNDKAYLISVFRYIHQNPYHAWIERKVSTYLWSSFHEYQNGIEKLADCEQMLSLFESREKLLLFLQTPVVEQHMEYFTWNRIPDSEALNLIKNLTGCSGPGEFQKVDIETRDSFLYELLKTGMSIRQLSRLTGVSRRVIEKVKVQKGH